MQRILVVDDNRDAATTLGGLLQMIGADVRVVYDGPAALEALRAFRPSVVMLDLGMPGMDGYEVAQRIRAQPDSVGHDTDRADRLGRGERPPPHAGGRLPASSGQTGRRRRDAGRADVAAAVDATKLRVLLPLH